ELHPVERAPRARGQLREALAYVRARPSLWLTLALVFFVATFGMNFQVTTALMSRGVFHTGAGAFGLASTMFAVGALGGALLAARRARPGMRLLLTTALAFGVLEVVAGLMPTFWSFLALLVPTGLALLMFTTTANSTTQLGTRRAAGPAGGLSNGGRATRPAGSLSTAAAPREVIRAAGEKFSLRRIMMHMIEQYARRTTAARDLLRERIDGTVAA